MITIESLKAAAADLSGTEQHFAELACEFMQRHALSSVPVVGSFMAPGVVLPRAGDKVKIPAGVLIRSTGPQGARTSQRSQHVTLSRVSKGGMYSERGEAVETPAVIVWAGAGGYWNEVSVRDWITAGGAPASD